jgi:hypothetical protein
MARKKGGLGQVETVTPPEDLLDTVFGKPRPEENPPAQASGNPPAKKDRVGKYFLLDRALAKRLKLYAVQHDLKEVAVIEASLRAFLEKAGQ